MLGNPSTSARLGIPVSLILLSALASVAAVSKGRAQGTPAQLGPGWHEPGLYEVDCGIVQNPPDAADVTYGLSSRTPRIGEEGRLTVVISEVRREDRDGRPTGPNLVGPSEDGEGCVATLTKSGAYQVTTESTIDRWHWVEAVAASSSSVQRAHTEPLAGKTETKTYTIYVRGDCSEDEIADPPTPEPDPVRDRLRDALQRALSARSQGVDENSITIEPLESGGLWRFAVRIGGNGCVIPSLHSMAACTSPQIGPAADLLLGSLQLAGGRSRINVRMVNPPTGIIEVAAKGDALGEDVAALERAATDALNGLDLTWACGGAP